MPMCSEDCDLIRKWRNIKRICSDTFFTVLKLTGSSIAVVVCTLFIIAMIGKCMSEMAR